MFGARKSMIWIVLAAKFHVKGRQGIVPYLKMNIITFKGLLAWNEQSWQQEPFSVIMVFDTLWFI